MRAKYCCDVKAHENYYLHQVGHGMPYFSGAAYQKGYGLGGIFSSIAKSVLPLIKSEAKAVGKQVLRSGVGFASDLLRGEDVKQAAINRARAAGTNLLDSAVRKRKNFPSKKVKKKRRKQHNDIFG